MVAAWWGILGVTLLLGRASLDLGARGVHTMRAGLTLGEWLALGALTGFFVYVEGMRALQRRFAPHVVDRALALRANAPVLWRVLAPFYVLGLVGAPARALVRAWGGVAAIVVAVLIVRAMPEPWRGVVDVAVAAALVWGTVALLVEAGRRLR